MSKIKFNNGESWQRADNPTVPKMGIDYWNEADKQDAYNYADSILAALKETVVVTVDSTIDTTGAVITLENITSGTSQEYVYQGSPLTLYVDAGVEYKIGCDASSLGLNVEQSGTYTALAANNRSISFDFRMASVEVIVTGADSGFEVVVAVDGTEITRQTEASATYSIRKGASVTLTPSSVDGYTAPSAESFTTEAGKAYSYTLAYEEVKLGVYIEDTTGKLWTADAWDGSATPNGVAVLTENCRFVVALEDSDGMQYTWSYPYNSATAIGVTTATGVVGAMEDYNGRSNTETIMTVMSLEECAFKSCVLYEFPNGQSGYLGAAGEWQAVIDNFDAFETARSKCDGADLAEINWTSTQYDLETAWVAAISSSVQGRGLDPMAKGNIFTSRAFTTLKMDS